MSNYIPYYYVDLIICPWHGLIVGWLIVQFPCVNCHIPQESVICISAGPELAITVSADDIAPLPLDARP